MKGLRLPRIDKDEELRNLLLNYCRIKEGEVWADEVNGHKVACVDVSDSKKVKDVFEGEKATLAVHDPPYNFVAFGSSPVEKFIELSAAWVNLTYDLLQKDASLYIWFGADQKKGFSPLPEFMLMMRQTPFKSKSFITLRNQRGYGTRKNWMSVRQELLFYVKGNPPFHSDFVYTEIPKAVKGYYKKVNGVITENIERSKSRFIRAGNVWIDVQQVFYLMEENVSGCFAQKPLKAIERIVKVSSSEGDLITDFFAHSGTTLLAAERNKRKCFTFDVDPVYCEISIRRLEHFRANGKIGWGTSNPFEKEIEKDKKLQKYLKEKSRIG